MSTYSVVENCRVQGQALLQLQPSALTLTNEWLVSFAKCYTIDKPYIGINSVDYHA